MTTPDAVNILRHIERGERLTSEQAVALLETAPLHELGELAMRARQRARPGEFGSYIVNTNINCTNVCVTRCAFCSFYRPVGDPEGYVLDAAEVVDRIRRAEARGAVQVLLQGGHHPRLGLDYYETLLAAISKETNVWVHALSAPEIVHISRVSKRSLKDVLQRLQAAGLQTLPGGGAELLCDDVRQAISPLKIDSRRWLEVHETAHLLGIRSSATMMFGTVHDGPPHWVAHLERLRALQDRTGGFTAFIPWTYQQGEAQVLAERVSQRSYLRLIAVARLFLDNFGTIQASPLTQGPQLASMALEYGADDLGNVLLEDHVVASAGCEVTLTEARARQGIADAGLTPRRRDTLYRLQPEVTRQRVLPMAATA